MYAYICLHVHVFICIYYDALTKYMAFSFDMTSSIHTIIIRIYSWCILFIYLSNSTQNANEIDDDYLWYASSVFLSFMIR